MKVFISIIVHSFHIPCPCLDLFNYIWMQWALSVVYKDGPYGPHPPQSAAVIITIWFLCLIMEIPRFLNLYNFCRDTVWIGKVKYLTIYGWKALLPHMHAAMRTTRISSEPAIFLFLSFWIAIRTSSINDVDGVLCLVTPSQHFLVFLALRPLSFCFCSPHSCFECSSGCISDRFPMHLICTKLPITLGVQVWGNQS
uniref:Uncharacterized protein n=1 Tax=Megaselia scalaris TaxID=36166 RepID=T1GI76_MEGSC